MPQINSPTPDATTLTKGKVQLAGVLAGTAAAPTFSTVTGAWTSYVPTWDNVTIGNATVDARYFQVGKHVTVTLSFVHGSTTSITGQVAVSLPVTAAARYTGSTAGMVGAGVMYIEDAGLSAYTGYFRAKSTTRFDLRAYDSAATYLRDTPISNTIPFTWASGDFLSGTFTYEAA